MNLQEQRKNRRKSIPDTNNLVFGKMPPQARELENAILGAIMIEKSAFELISDVLRPESFYVDANQRIYAVMVALASRNAPINLLTVVEQLKKTDELEMVGGAFYVAKLTNAVVSSGGLEYHARILQEKFIKRELIRIAGNTISEAYEDSTDTFEILGEHEKELTAIQNGITFSTVDSSEKIVLESISHIEELRKKESHITGIPSGFSELDRITHGWQDNDLIIVAARPSMGKTAFALRLMRNAVKNAHKPVTAAFFSLEMSKGQLMNRLLASESDVYLGNILSGRITNDEMDQLNIAAGTIAKLRFYIDDTPGLSIMELKSKARKLHRKHKLGILFVDYLQLMSDSSKNNREQEISSISRNLKAIAKELKIPVIALSQLSREVEKRTDKTPQMSDLRESGAIEQDADMILFMYRPEYYGLKTNEDGESNSGLCEIKIAKNRNGSLDKIMLRSELGVQKFFDWTGSDNSDVPKGFKAVQTLIDDEPF